MTHKSPTFSFCAGSAIAAFLAFGSAGLQAQDAVLPAQSAAPTVPAPVAQPTASTPITTPTIDLPRTDEPAVSAAREVETTAERKRSSGTPKPALRAKSTQTAAPTTRVEAPRVTPSGPGTPQTPAGIVPNAPLPADPASIDQPVPTAPAAATNGNEDRAAIVAVSLLGLAVLGGMGAAFAARRRRNDPLDEEPETIASEQETVATDAVLPVRAAPASKPARTMPSPGFFTASAMPAATADGGAVRADPNEEREALIAQMVAAAPDAENPYTTAAKRRRKARMLLAAGEKEEASKSREFDFRNHHAPTTPRVLSDGDSVEA